MKTRVIVEVEHDGRKADYTERPLTDEERAFASDEENYNQLFRFMRTNRLDPEEWYDILIIPYLNAVKKYCSREELHKYPFFAITEKVLSCAYHHYWRSVNTQKRMPEGGFVSLDYTLEGDNPFAEHNIEKMWIDHNQQVERVVLDKEMFEGILINLDRIQVKIFEMLLEGYNKKEIQNRLCISYEALKKQLEELQNVVSDYLSM